MTTEPKPPEAPDDGEILPDDPGDTVPQPDEVEDDDGNADVEEADPNGGD